MDIYAYTPLIITTIAAAIALFLVFNYFRTKKLPPTDEPVVGDYRIEVDVGTHIIPFEGTLYYNTKYLNPQFAYTFGKQITKGDKVTTDEMTKLHDHLKEKGHFYAMRMGTKKVAFISLEHPIEMKPFFKTEENTGKKIVHATGFYSKHEINGFQQVTFSPIDLSINSLNPPSFELLENTGKLVALVNEKGPLLQQITTEQEKNRILQGKVDGLADEVGKKTDELEYWKELAKRKGIESTEKEGFRIPPIIRTITFYGALFVIGLVITPSIPQLENIPSPLVGVGLTVVGYIIRRLLKK